MLRIIEASDPIKIDTIVTVFYSPPGIGKTSLAFTSLAPLLLDADKGAHRSGFRKTSVRPSTWDKIGSIEKKDTEGYSTLIIDTAGRALDMLAQDIIRITPKYGRSGGLTLQGFGVLKSRFAAYLTMIREFGLDVVLIAHSTETQSGDDIIERLDMQGGSKQEVLKSSDAMARLGMVNGKRMLMFSPTETQFGKDPAGLGRVEVPDFANAPFFLAELIDQIKVSLNAQSAEMVAASKLRTEWADKVAEATSGAEYTALIEHAPDNRAKRVLLDAATAAGCEWDKDDKRFRGKDPEPPADEPEPEAAPEPESDPDHAEESERDSLPF